MLSFVNCEGLMQPIGHLVNYVLAILRTKLDGSPITTYLDQKEVAHGDSNEQNESSRDRQAARGQ